MNKFWASLGLVGALLAATGARANNYSDAIEVFKKTGESAEYFKHAYAYAVFPTVGRGYTKGMAVFAIAKGGLMYAATLAGQKYSYKPCGTG